MSVSYEGKRRKSYQVVKDQLTASSFLSDSKQIATPLGCSGLRSRAWNA